MLAKRESENNAAYFSTGVLDLIFNTWFITAFPGLFWIYSSIKFIVIAIRQHRRHIADGRGKHIWMIEFCYVSNLLFSVYFLFCLLRWTAHYKNTHHWDYYFLRISFAWANGPLGLSLIQQMNGFAFHALDHMTMLSIHIGPPLTFYALRYYSAQTDHLLPGIFYFNISNTEDLSDTFVGLFLFPSISYVVLWSLPYAIYMTTIFPEKCRRAKGYITIIGDLKESNSAIRYILTMCGEQSTIFVYLLVHAFIVFLTFLPSQLLWRYYWVNTAYIVVLTVIAAINGGKIMFLRLIPRLIAHQLVLVTTPFSNQENIDEINTNGEHIDDDGRVHNNIAESDIKVSAPLPICSDEENQEILFVTQQDNVPVGLGQENSVKERAIADVSDPLSPSPHLSMVSYSHTSITESRKDSLNQSHVAMDVNLAGQSSKLLHPVKVHPAPDGGPGD